MITREQLIQIVGKNKESIVDNVITPLNNCLEKYAINNKLRICHFLAQVLHESGAFRYTKENLNYSAEGLLKTFGKYFKTLEDAKKYERQPEKIANKVYANRYGNGSEESGDGYKYCGRGFIQTTFKSNYNNLSKSFNIDFINQPQLLEIPEWACLSAGYYWKSKNLNLLADKDALIEITKKINGGLIGLKDREGWLNICKTVLK